MSNNKFYVYVYRHPITKIPFYVGKGSDNRIWHHLSETYENTENRKKYAVIKNLLNDNLTPIIGRYAKNLNEEDAYNIEEYLICKWGRRDIDENGVLTNICSSNRPPSSKGRKRSEETKQKISLANKGEKNGMFGRRGELAPMYGVRRFGPDSPRYGKTHTLEVRQAIAARNVIVHTGRKRSAETKEKMSNAQIGKKLREETKEKLRAANLGKKQSKSTIELRREKQIGRPRPSKRWVWIFTSPTGIIFHSNSLKSFCVEHNLNENIMRKYENSTTPTNTGWLIKKIPKTQQFINNVYS